MGLWLGGMYFETGRATVVAPDDSRRSGLGTKAFRRRSRCIAFISIFIIAGVCEDEVDLAAGLGAGQLGEAKLHEIELVRDQEASLSNMAQRRA
jgi:hypothetical protein